jgi:hypothetical protein
MRLARKDLNFWAKESASWSADLKVIFPLMSMHDSKWQPTARANALGFDWCVKNAVASLQSNDLNEAMSWCSVAAHSAANDGFYGMLASSELEDVLLQVAQHLPVVAPAPRNLPPRRWLHVFSTAYALLGHTKLCREWMKLDAQGRQHSVILLSQDGAVPENLARAVSLAGGSIIRLDNRKRPAERAQELRVVARQRADVVVLHTHPDDVIAPVAFGVPGGPPVIMVNHADHAFWVGRGVVDLLLDIRDSGHSWSLENRAISRAEIVPIPLSELDATTSDASCRLESRRTVRRELGIPAEAVVLLTIGNAFKYTAIPGFDFCRTAEEILKSCLGACLVAVGPKNTGSWKAAGKTTNGRLIAVGNQSELSRFHAAADIYLEGFPSGSLTALLEAAQAGLPVVLAPETCALPFRSDGIATSMLAQPVDLADYRKMVVDFVNNPDQCRRAGEAGSRSVHDHHCGETWLNHLRRATLRLPGEHAVYHDPMPVPVQLAKRDYCLACRSVLKYRSAADAELVSLSAEALRRGLRNRIALDGQFLKPLCSNDRRQARQSLWGMESPVCDIRLGFKARSIRRRALAEARAMEAFEAFSKGERSRALYLAGKCCLGDPSWLWDKGLERLFLKSLIGGECYGWLRSCLRGSISKGWFHRTADSAE